MITLSAGAAVLELAPELGGAIAFWRVGGVDVMRPTPPDATKVGDFACFPLVPYSNRIANARFAGFTLRRNFGDHPHSIHGVGWQRAWAGGQTAAGQARLTLAHPPDDDWPFAFAATQAFALEPDRLTITLSLRNTDPRPAPAGLGLHPYFPRTAATTLDFAAGSVWRNGADHLPAERVVVPPGWCAGPAATGLDNCFAGWDGAARIGWPDRGLALRITAGPPLRHLIVFTPPGRDDLAVEPVSHMNDAVHRMDTVPDHGMVVLPPGAGLSASVVFTIER